MTLVTPVELLQALVRFDTTNPPGNEAACIGHIAGLLRDAGLAPQLFALMPERPNLVVRLEGRGEAAPVLVHGHVDVVTTNGQPWSRPPFSGELVDDTVWGRGTLDMKGGVTMLLSALLRMKAEGVRPPSDVILAVVSDEEAGCDHGSRFLVERHPDLFAGVRYSFGEGGGGSSELAGHRIYRILVAEKRVCWMRAVLRGAGGHGSAPVFGQAMAKLRRLLEALDSRWLPVHVTPPARLMIEGMAAVAPDGLSGTLLELLDPSRTDLVLDELGGLKRRLGPALHNTVSVTTLRAGEKVNVIPTEVHVDLDGRLLPGCSAADLVAEIRAVAGGDFDLEVVRTEAPARLEPDLSAYPFLAGLIREMDPEGVPIPALQGGFTDGCQFEKLGIQNYGFLPLRMPPGFHAEGLSHAADERIPVEALNFGVEAMYRLLTRFPG